MLLKAIISTCRRFNLLKGLKNSNGLLPKWRLIIQPEVVLAANL